MMLFADVTLERASVGELPAQADPSTYYVDITSSSVLRRACSTGRTAGLTVGGVSIGSGLGRGAIRPVWTAILVLFLAVTIIY
jgi:hypothetical protein